MPHKSKCLKTPSYYGEDEVNAQNCLIPLELNWGARTAAWLCGGFMAKKAIQDRIIDNKQKNLYHDKNR